MLLDAPALKLVLTPENALGMVQKELSKKGWQKYEVSQIKLVYTPYYTFSFDILVEGTAPAGNAALNAFTGELNDFVPMILGRPSQKVRSSEMDGEVERTAIKESEVKEVAQAKLAAHAGVKKDTVVVSAVNKIYLPFYRIWLNAANDSFQVNIDAAVGAPFGFEAIPVREKTLKEAKNAKEFVEMAGKTLKGEAGKGPASFLSTTAGKYLALFAVAIVLFYLVFFQTGGQSVSCKVDSEFLGAKPLFGDQLLNPLQTSGGDLVVKGTCYFTNQGKDAQTICARTFIKSSGVEIPGNYTCAVNVPPGDYPSQKSFTVSWKGDPLAGHSLGFEKG
jgi:hypothetical protein